MKIAENPLAGGSFLNWMRLLKDNRGLQGKYFARALYVTVMTSLFTPLRFLQNWIYGPRIEDTSLDRDPVFLLGHYRTGGTYLMNLLTQDRQWGYISTTQALLPELFLLGRAIRNIFQLFLHEKRPMDNVPVSPESPEEPEHAIGNLIPYGFYQGFCFPHRMMAYFRNSVLFEGDSSGTIQQQWEQAYLYILKAGTLVNQGKPLLVKNPPDTARIPALLKLFPNARFIFLYRNPYVLFPSIKNFYQAYIVDWQLTDIDEESLEKNILVIYREMMERYQQDKHLIPQGHLVEVKFEDVENRPLEAIKRIYDRLSLPNFEVAVPAFQAYIESQKNYQKNRYALTPETIKRIEQGWSPHIQRWGYSPQGAVEIVKPGKY
jgi:hypothetical protein